MKRILFCVVFFATIPSGLLKGQDVSVSASFDTSGIFIGDQVHFNIIIDQPAGITLNLPYFRDTIIKNIEIISGPHSDTISTAGGKIRITERYLITSFDSGRYRIDPVFAEMRDQSGIKRYFSGYSALNVMRVDIAPADTTSAIFDIIKPYGAPLTFDEVLPWLLLSLLSVILLWLLIRLIRRFRKTRGEIQAPVITEPAHVIAFRELERLREEKLWQSGAVKKYYTRLTEILRTYLENRYGVNSMELTTFETLDSLLNTGFKRDDSFNKLKAVLTGADLVKFAKYKPDPSENELNFEHSWDFVSATMEKEKISEPDEEVIKSREESV